jgi:hypothetical protein
MSDRTADASVHAFEGVGGVDDLALLDQERHERSSIGKLPRADSATIRSRTMNSFASAG